MPPTAPAPAPDAAIGLTYQKPTDAFDRQIRPLVSVAPAAHVPASEPPDADYPLLLNTGRIYHHYHTGTMTRNCSSLNRESPEALLQINPLDATRLTLRSGDLVRLSSRRGAITVKAEVTEQVPTGSVYTTFHFRDAPINRLTVDARDPKAQCPEFKICAVRLEKVAA